MKSYRQILKETFLDPLENPDVTTSVEASPPVDIWGNVHTIRQIRAALGQIKNPKWRLVTRQTPTGNLKVWRI